MYQNIISKVLFLEKWNIIVQYHNRSQEIVDLSEEATNYQPPQDSLKSSKHPKIEAPLKTMDVFAGCGGLSAGLESSGVAKVESGKTNLKGKFQCSW
jgi:hypothetical protein